MTLLIIGVVVVNVVCIWHAYKVHGYLKSIDKHLGKIEEQTK